MTALEAADDRALAVCHDGDHLRNAAKASETGVFQGRGEALERVGGEDISDIMFELDALLEGSELLGSKIYLGVPDENWPGRAGRLIYPAKPS
jgi:hypothetical protein